MWSGKNGMELQGLGNYAAVLNATTPYVGTIRRWYCMSGCSGRFHGIYMNKSSLGTLEGCALRIYAKLTGMSCCTGSHSNKALYTNRALLLI